MEDENGKYMWQSDSAIDVKLLGLDTRLHVAVDFGASFIISGILAVIFRTMTAPVERVKLILQTQASSHQIGNTKRSAYSGILNALVRIPKEQGFASLWRGNLLNICRYFPAQAINFSFYNLYYEIFQKVRPTDYQWDYPFLMHPSLKFTRVNTIQCCVDDWTEEELQSRHFTILVWRCRRLHLLYNSLPPSFLQYSNNRRRRWQQDN